MDRLLNHIFIFILIFLFILEGNASDHLNIILALVLSFLVALLAFMMNWITFDGFRSAIVFGTVTFGLAGWLMASLILFFFISGSLLSRNRERMQEPESGMYSSKFRFRRNGIQVWANGFWVTFFIVLWYIFELDFFYIASAAAIATATSDTWATEIGNRGGARTILITTFKEVQPGTEGGVSRNGLLGALAGALCIGLIYFILDGGPGIRSFVIIFISGFAGCLVDSLFGARFQTGKESKQRWFRIRFPTIESANNAVNWAATGISAILAIIIMQWI